MKEPGTVHTDAAMLPRAEALAQAVIRIMKRIAVDEAGCWVWQGPTTHKGYAQIKSPALGGKRYIHRIMCEHAHGPIAPEMQVDHLCRVRACCNPAHLEAVTAAVNTQRSYAARPDPTARYQTHCVHGHPLSGENVCQDRRGTRSCRACRGRRNQEWNATRRARAVEKRRAANG